MTGYSSSTGYYIHAKTIIADYGTSSAKAFAGSENFSDNSLNDNRELGLIITDSGVVSGLEAAFNADFSGSAGGKVGIISPGTQTTAAGTAVNLPGRRRATPRPARSPTRPPGCPRACRSAPRPA